MIYLYRYQSFTDGKPTTHVRYRTDNKFAEIIRTEGSCTAYARELSHRTTRVKPRNMLTLPAKYFPRPIDHLTGMTVNWTSWQAAIRHKLDLFAALPWTLDFSTINIEDYPEFFL